MNKIIPSILILLLFGFVFNKQAFCKEPASKQVLKRILGTRASEFTFKTISNDSENPDKMVFEIEAKNGKVVVSGNSGIAQCRGAYTYLKETCNVMISWGGKHINLPAKLPDYLSGKVVCPFKYTLQDNICTFGYTTPYFGWEDWEKYLDIMALHGYNMMQAPIGTEAIWKKVWMNNGFSESELYEYFTGPAFLPWHRMGNINKHGGPVQHTYFEKSIILQKKILRRMRELGIHPVAPAFAGFVPKEFETKFSDAKVRHVHGWVGFKGDCTTHILHPLSPYYKKIGKEFIDEWRHEFGDVDFYLADAFNELQPPVSSKREKIIQHELADFGNSIYSSINAADPGATWLMMGWLFMDKGFWSAERAKALVSKVPDNKMMVLDLYAETEPFYKSMDNFFGKQWMYSVIPNWGGVSQLGGLLTKYGTLIPEAAANPNIGELVAFGYSPEGTKNNEVIYELVSDAMWSNSSIEYKSWLGKYCLNRYGIKNANLEKAWGLLGQSVYNKEVDHAANRVQTGPDNLNSSYQVAPLADKNVDAALTLFLSVSEKFKSNQLFINDIIELATYKHIAIADSMLTNLLNSIGNTPAEESDKQMKQISELVNKIDLLLASHSLYKLDSWIEKARLWGDTPEEKLYFEADAKRIITLWGSNLTEYSARLWSGLLSDFYMSRWETWFEKTKNKEEIDIKAWGMNWIETSYNKEHRKTGNPFEIIHELETISK